MVEARQGHLAGEDVVDVLGDVRLERGGAGARGVVLRLRQGVGGVERVPPVEAPLGLERHRVVDRLAVEADGADAAQLGHGPALVDGTRAGEGHVADGGVVGPDGVRAHVGHLDHRLPRRLHLHAAAPRLRVLDAVVVVHDRAADAAGGVAGQDVAGLVGGGELVRRGVDLLQEEERQVPRERGLHAVRPLVQEDAVAAAQHHRALVAEQEREPGPGGEADPARAQEAAVPAELGRRHPGNRHQRHQRLGRGRDGAGVVARDDEAPARHREVDRRQAVVDVLHVGVVLVAQPVVDGQVVARPPVVLGVEVQPRGARVLVAAADAGPRRGRVAEEEVGHRVAAPLPRIAEGAARGVGVDGTEPQVEQVAAELVAVVAAVDEEVVVDLEVLVVPRHERRGVAHGAEQPRRRDLGEADVAGVPAHPEQADPLREVDPRVLAVLPAVHRHVPEAQLVQLVPADGLGVAHPDVAGRGVERPAEPRHEGFLLDAGAEGLDLVGVEGAEPQEEVVGLGRPVVDAHAELVHVLVLRLDRRQVLEPPVGRRQGHVPEEGAGDGVEPVRRNPVAREGPARAGRGVDGQRIADRVPAREVAAPDRRVGHREGLGD